VPQLRDHRPEGCHVRHGAHVRGVRRAAIRGHESVPDERGRGALAGYRNAATAVTIYGGPAMTLEQRTFLVTGANSGIGLALVEALAARCARLVLAGRSEARTMPVLNALEARYPGLDASFLHLDVSDLSSVRTAAAGFLASRHPLDVLVNNAGIAGTNALSRDGFDVTYATNHIGPFLLTNLLLPRLRESDEAPVGHLARMGHQRRKTM